ncbi:MAG: UvrB/UvrC motif-containing protein, partial [Coriobacteriia bacterium]|nr:UvrB/UvrC motif-containing protein [Coriobacteriia bacterium]
RAVERFLNGNQREFIENLESEMKDAAKNLDFERADRIKKRIETVNLLTEKQHIVSQQNLNADVIGFYREETIAGVHVLIVREGRIINSNEFILNRGLDVENEDLVHNFLLRYYDTTTSIPQRIIMRENPEDIDEMSE